MVEIGSHQDVANSRHHEHHEDQDGGTRCASNSHADLRGQEGIRIVKLAANVLEENVKYAEQTRRYLREACGTDAQSGVQPGCRKDNIAH
jgi:hypothetical protein